MNIYLIDDRGELWHGASRQLRAEVGADFSGSEFVAYAVQNLGFIAVSTHGAACRVRLRPTLVATSAFTGLRNWLRESHIERVVITQFKGGWWDGVQHELVGRAHADQRIDALLQSKLSSAASKAAGTSGSPAACMP